MKVVDVRTHVLLDPGYDPAATSSAQDTIVVEVATDEGIVGIGETDLNAWVARACIEAPGMHTMDAGLAETLVGLDPLDPVAVWHRLYVGTAMTGRRGAGKIFYNQVQASGRIPQVCCLLGPSAAGGAYIPAFCDVVFMHEKNASMYLGSPRMTEMVIGEKTTLEDMGGARMHATVSGSAGGAGGGSSVQFDGM